MDRASYNNGVPGFTKNPPRVTRTADGESSESFRNRTNLETLVQYGKHNRKRRANPLGPQHPVFGHYRPSPGRRSGRTDDYGQTLFADVQGQTGGPARNGTAGIRRDRDAERQDQFLSLSAGKHGLDQRGDQGQACRVP